ncbi:hypothetical protein [Taibaiella koreensis]|uniref:hypothetical protein n=1 Tax=Taibaiella koreensis TaxID=1268548 RepID=UPI0013C2C25F|nr:hypothetical protein [Taibaiella koreensis]
MSKGNKKKPKLSRFKDAVTGRVYKKAVDNAKASSAAAAYAIANPKKAFYA